ncbi:sugar transferase [Frigoribacterium sp. 9N]|uniref:sugar transferase n=1 Tax=Frigoribacterium sp. 9N TaxID=2653144 RepID=UPI0012F07344|nr:sugar transferase [Frigoribacterium sp. 9N]VXB26964.1 putative phosphotransferase involved in extracellular matrix synthesis [Frigoribacterium sp. 9N]
MKAGLADRIAKRALDVAVAGVGLLVTAPVQLVLAAVIARRLGRPVLFVQARPGKGAKVFHLVKFRTMLPVDESRGLVTDEDRMTAFGATLRSTSLDELPTLWNVLRGDMSLVGPRPLLVRYLDRYSPRQAHRHDVRPGVTGLAQISGRNAISWDAKLELDVQYVQTKSFVGDLRILALTAIKVVRRQDITEAGSATVSEFHGSGFGSS